MSSFSAPNMTAVSPIGQANAWNVGAVPLQFTTGSPFSIEAWIMLGASAQNVTVFSKPGEFSIGVANAVVMAGWPGQSYSGTTVLTSEVWHYIAVCFDGTNFALYLDGAPEYNATCPGAGMPVTASDFMIGASVSANDPCDVSSVTLYNVARSSADEESAPWIDLLTIPELVANFDFSIAPAQETVQGYVMTPLMNDASQTLAPAVFFDGSQGAMLIGNGTAPSIPAQFTISAWVATNNSSTPQAIFSSGDPASDPNAIELLYSQVNGQTSIVCTFGGQSAIVLVADQASVDQGDWHNVAVSCDSGEVAVYFDGQLLLNQAISSTVNPTLPMQWTAGFAIQNGAKTNFFSGFIQWLTIWGRSLSPDEVVYQQYSEVATDPTVMADITLDAVPPQDIAALLPLQFGGTALSATQRNTVTTWSPPAQQLNPSPFAPLALERGIARAREARPATHSADLATAAQLEMQLARLDHDVATRLKNAYWAKWEAAQALAQADPSGLVRGKWIRDGDEHVFLYRHASTGQYEEFVRVPLDFFSPCQMWWMGFMSSLLMGFANLLFISIKGKDLMTWIQNRILNNQTAMQALQAAWQANPGMTGFGVVNLLGVIYQLGLMRNFLWFAAYKVGYFALFKLFAYIASLVLTSGATTVLFAANAGVLATELATQLVGASNVPSYSAACNSAEGCAM